MSEYQCYEFVALDRSLTAKQLAELRAISTRAEISPTRFWNEYQWGDLKADPAKLMARYFDTHLYFANWGTHRLMLRLAKEPPVPAGLAELTGAQEAMIEFLRIDVDLVAAAAAGCSTGVTDDGAAFRRWLAARPDKEKTAWLRRAADEPDLALGGELLRTFRATAKRDRPGPRRIVGELRALAAALRAERENAAAARANRARAAADAARQRHLTALARDVEVAWTRLEKLVGASRYDEAETLAVDLRDLATRDGAAAGFADRFEVMRKRQLRRRGFFGRWKRANDHGSRR